jgi:hypothetical protein
VLPLSSDAAGTDDSDTVEMSDAICTVKYLYVPGSPPPPEPGPGDCGADPAQDDLECEGHSCMGSR